MKRRPELLPFFFVAAFSTVFIQALMIGFDSAGMQGVFIASAVANIPLGLFVGTVWSPRLAITGIIAGLPALLFMFALHQWSVVHTLTRTVEGVPVILEPISVSAFFILGGWLGGRLFAWRERRTHSSSQS